MNRHLKLVSASLAACLIMLLPFPGLRNNARRARRRGNSGFPHTYACTGVGRTGGNTRSNTNTHGSANDDAYADICTDDTPVPTPTDTPVPSPTLTPPPTDTPVPTPTPSPQPWRTFEYGKDERDASCDTNPNYRIDVPPGWTKQPYLRCGYVQYRPQDDNALLSVDWWDSPEYSSSPSQALKELTEDHQG